MYSFGRKNGISLLMATQNAIKTVELSIRSFVDFADEIIVVDNGSTDGTIQVVEKLEKEFEHIQFYNCPDIQHLYENRQFAYKKSKYKWIMRCDSDFVAYTSGKYDIKNLRENILNYKLGLRPLSFGFPTINLIDNFKTTGTFYFKREDQPEYNTKSHVSPVFTDLNNRVYEYHPLLKFVRLGRWEGVRFSKLFKQKFFQNVYFFHCELKTKREYLIRSERTNWRELGDFDKFPTLISYVNSILLEKYGTKDIKEASNIYYNKYIQPFLTKYNEDEYIEYPALIKEYITK
jgi:glycosyltransferase involved in cell wall biosynthesis